MAVSPVSQRDVDMTWVEKYLTYEQAPDGTLRLTDVHFLAEIVFETARQFEQITATLHAGESAPIATYTARDQRAFTNGAFYTRKTQSFPHVEALEARFPPTTQFTWEISGPSGHHRLAPMRIGGAAAKTCFPTLSRIRLAQQRGPVSDFHALDAHADLRIEWDRLSTAGPRLEQTVWSDFTFLLVSNQEGEVLFTGGAPGFSERWLDHNATSVTVPAGTLSPGEDYVVFISQVHGVDYNLSHGIEQLAHNSFAVEAPVRTIGQPSVKAGTPAKKAQYLWSRKTRGPGLETWPTLTDYWT